MEAIALEGQQEMGWMRSRDPERRLWFCDIKVNTGAAYWPFLRLALARHQPCSTKGAHLSEVVLAQRDAVRQRLWGFGRLR